MKQNTFLRAGIFIAAALAAIGAGSSLHINVARAIPISIISDAGTVYSISTEGFIEPCGNKGLFSCALSPSFNSYSASSSFSIQKITFDWRNSGANNCDNFGNYGAIITSAADANTIIATSTNTTYLGCAGFAGDNRGMEGTGELDFAGEIIPSNFYLSFGAFDGGTQGGSRITITNVSVYASPFLREPVVIIPGIMGSSLDASSTGEEIWPNVSKMLSSRTDDYLDALKLTSSGISTVDIYAPDIIREATGTFVGIPITDDFYGGLINALTPYGYQEGNNLFVFPYDWRLDINTEVDALAAKIALARAASPDGKVDVVAHSMGGLLLKKYLAGISDTSFIDKAVLAGVPELGAPKDFSILNYGDDLGLSWLGLFGLNVAEVKSISQNMPAVYELLPSRRYVQVAGSYVSDFREGAPAQIIGYDQTSAFMASDPTDARNPALLSLADLFHQALDGTPLHAANVYNIVGCSRPTITGFDLYDDGDVDIERGNGDGTVPALSAMDAADGYKNYFVEGGQTGIDHLGLVRDDRTAGFIGSLVASLPAISITPPAGISDRSVDCFDPGSASTLQNETTYEFSTHSPVSLDLYDQAGDHTGINADGKFEMGIPGSEYEAIGENAFVMVPASGTYKVVTKSTATTTGDPSTFTLKVKGYKGSSPDRIATYSDVPVPTASSTGELDFSGFNQGMGMKINNNTVDPSSLASDTASLKDKTPPTFLISGIVSPVFQNATASIVFGATDSGSGVASTSATFNGVPFLSGQVITYAAIGTSTFRFHAVDSAGNPATHIVKVSIIPAPASPPNQAPSSTPVLPPAPTSTPASTSTIGIKTVSLPVFADTSIAKFSPNQNSGTDKLLRLQDSLACRESRILLQVASSTFFNLLGTPHGFVTYSSRIISAKLVLTIGENWRNWNKKGGELDLYRMATPWTERGATWNCPDDTKRNNRSKNCSPAWNMFSASPPLWAAVPTASTTVDNKSGGTISFDVTADVKAFLTHTENDGWIIKKANESAAGLINFYSKESVHKPVLILTYQ